MNVCIHIIVGLAAGSGLVPLTSQAGGSAGSLAGSAGMAAAGGAINVSENSGVGIYASAPHTSDYPTAALNPAAAFTMPYTAAAAAAAASGGLGLLTTIVTDKLQ